jgi:hypothetical protein
MNAQRASGKRWRGESATFNRCTQKSAKKTLHNSWHVA